MRVLYINHTSHVSGGERSLLDVVRHLPSHVSPALACPTGDLRDHARELGVPVLPVPAMEASLKLTPRLAARGTVELGRLAWAVRRRVAEFSPHVLHANSIRSGIAASQQSRRHPAVVHVRDCLPGGRVAVLSLRLATGGAAAVIANSGYTATCLARASPGVRPHVIHSPVDLRRFDPTVLERTAARRRLALADSDFVLAVVGQLTPWKGQDDAVRILAGLKPSLPEARLVLVGSPKFVSEAARYDNRAYLGSLQALVRQLNLDHDVRFLGEREDVPEILAAVDVLLLPSWEEPFGRSAIEGMAMGLPVLATRVGGPAEVIENDRDGLLLPPRQPGPWVAAIRELASSPERRAALGTAARQRVESGFGVETHVAAILRVYREALEGPGGRPERRTAKPG